ncbi:MAG: sulfite dehydrogenase [Acidobacteria bacterium RIFCSPLOWO2_02_FULL_68_18]|nr:MAG: sulfite dehydrogenase [Acidobacteria bacterium RIFCSPLOWO2_02_FULL_68_18]OFW48701.1 MAG: sulfite dehydrogenase [Acidobacteria bacterium RIFCSPLOWO2_12_FULL_68_19]
MKPSFPTSRRDILRMGAAAMGGTLLSEQEALALDTPGTLGAPLGPYGDRSPFEKAVRWRRESKTPETGSSFTPLQDSVGTLTPSSLHYERHHSGIPTIDPARHRLVIHGMVDRPLSLSMADIRRLPSVTRTMVLECGGNSASEWAATTAPDVQRSFGLASCSEWTGVSLPLLLAEARVRPGASWVIAEGADACRMERSIPLAKALDDAFLAYGQNGEALRPAQGYPLRLRLPGWEGNANVKWLHSLKLTDQPYMARDETSKYSDLMPDGKARIFSYRMEAKSVITFPSGGQTVPGPGVYELTGLAWSGLGRIERVEITTDGGKTWTNAKLQEPRLPIAFTRFRLPWRFDGREAVIASRATDETGYLQPSREALVAVRGTNSVYHFNGMKFWRVRADGAVSNVEV